MVQSSSSATSSGGGGGGGTDTRDPANLVNPVPKADAADISAIDDTTDNHEVGFDGESTTTSSSATLINSIIMGDETFSASSQEDALAAAALSQDYFFIRWNIEHIWRKWEVRGANVSSNANSGDQGKKTKKNRVCIGDDNGYVYFPLIPV